MVSSHIKNNTQAPFAYLAGIISWICPSKNNDGRDAPSHRAYSFEEEPFCLLAEVLLSDPAEDLVLWLLPLEPFDLPRSL